MAGKEIYDANSSRSSGGVEEEFLLDDDEGVQRGVALKRSRRWHVWHLILNYFIIGVLTGALVWEKNRLNALDLSSVVYSPIDAIVEYKPKLFADNVFQTTPYQEPYDDETDKLWDDLYNASGFVLLDYEDAMRIPNETVLIGKEKKGLVQIEVMHQLHCLNTLRKILTPARYPDFRLHNPDGTESADVRTHINHCVDRLRQGVMCNSDTGLLFWSWHEKVQEYVLNFGSMHKCANFDAVRDWAFSRNTDADNLPSNVYIGNELRTKEPVGN